MDLRGTALIYARAEVYFARVSTNPSSTASHSPGAPSRGLIWLALLCVYVVWGSTYLAIRVAVHDMPPFMLGGVRFIIAGGVFFLWALARRRIKARRTGEPPARVEAKHWLNTGVVGAALLLGGNGAVIMALRHVTSSMIALLVATTPFWMLLIGRVWLRERTKPQHWMGLVLGFSGVYLLVSSKVGASVVHPIGAALGLFASLSWAVGTLYSRRYDIPKDSMLATSMEMMWGGVLMLALGIVLGEPARFNMAAFSWQAWSALLYLIVFGSWIGFTAYAWLVKVAPLPLVSSYAYVNPMIALLLGALILDEPVNARMLFAAGIIVAAVAITVMQTPPRVTRWVNSWRPQASKAS